MESKTAKQSLPKPIRSRHRFLSKHPTQPQPIDHSNRHTFNEKEWCLIPSVRTLAWESQDSLRSNNILTVFQTFMQRFARKWGTGNATILSTETQFARPAQSVNSKPAVLRVLFSECLSWGMIHLSRRLGDFTTTGTSHRHCLRTLILANQLRPNFCKPNAR